MESDKNVTEKQKNTNSPVNDEIVTSFSHSKARFKPYTIPSHSNKVELQGPKVFSGVATDDLKFPLSVHNVKTDQITPYRLKSSEEINNEERKDILTVNKFSHNNL